MHSSVQNWPILPGMQWIIQSGSREEGAVDLELESPWHRQLVLEIQSAGQLETFGVVPERAQRQGCVAGRAQPQAYGRAGRAWGCWAVRANASLELPKLHWSGRRPQHSLREEAGVHGGLGE